MVTNHTTATPTDLSANAVEEISSNLRRLLADVFTLYVKTKNFHWHISGRHFRDYHLLLDEQATEIFAITDTIAERARKIGGTTIRSISDIAKNQRLKDNNKESVSPMDMISELREDNQQLTRSLRAAREVCDRHNDVATASFNRGLDRRERKAHVVFGGDSTGILKRRGDLKNCPFAFRHCPEPALSSSKGRTEEETN
jgi:starvation-inducible DNA-binding protein